MGNSTPSALVEANNITLNRPTNQYSTWLLSEYPVTFYLNNFLGPKTAHITPITIVTQQPLTVPAAFGIMEAKVTTGSITTELTTTGMELEIHHIQLVLASTTVIH